MNIVVWLSIYQHKDGPLKVYFLDVGQGDAIFIETPTKKQILVDGGKNRKVISELGKIMPFGDKSIDDDWTKEIGKSGIGGSCRDE